MQRAIFLILSLFLCSCAMKPVPINHLYAIDTDHLICGKYTIVNKTTLEVNPNGEDLPIESCNGYIAISRNEYKEFQSWVKDVLDKAKKKAARAKIEVESMDLKQDFQQIENLP